MPRLEDLRKSLLDMTDEELRAKFREIRADRKITKETRKAKARRVQGSAKARNTIEKLMAELSPEEIAILLADSEGAEDARS